MEILFIGVAILLIVLILGWLFGNDRNGRGGGGGGIDFDFD